jgi:hypothetical protein
MNQERINKQIFVRLSKLESAVFGGKRKIKAIAGAGKSLADHIITLRDRAIFKQPLIPQEVHKRLEPIYHCDLSRVKVELIRLQKRGQLRKTSKLIKSKKYIAYVW